MSNNSKIRIQMFLYIMLFQCMVFAGISQYGDLSHNSFMEGFSDEDFAEKWTLGSVLDELEKEHPDVDFLLDVSASLGDPRSEKIGADFDVKTHQRWIKKLQLKTLLEYKMLECDNEWNQGLVDKIKSESTPASVLFYQTYYFAIQKPTEQSFDYITQSLQEHLRSKEMCSENFLLMCAVHLSEGGKRAGDLIDEMQLYHWDGNFIRGMCFWLKRIYELNGTNSIEMDEFLRICMKRAVEPDQIGIILGASAKNANELARIKSLQVKVLKKAIDRKAGKYKRTEDGVSPMK